MKTHSYFFPTIIWRRGLEYYQDGLVSDLKYDVSSDSCTATVHGMNDYSVRITLDDGDIRYMTCDCPYATGGKNCKHMAAVVRKMDQENVFLKSNSTFLKWNRLFKKYEGKSMSYILKNADAGFSKEITPLKENVFDNLLVNLGVLDKLFRYLSAHEQFRLPTTNSLLSDILNELADATTNQEEIYHWFYSQMVAPQCYMTQGMLDDLFYENGQASLGHLNALIQYNEKNKNVSYFISRKLRRLRSLKLSDEQIYEAMKQHMGNPAADEFLLDYFMKYEKYDEAKDITTIITNRPMTKELSKKIDRYRSTIAINTLGKDEYIKIVINSINNDNYPIIQEHLTRLKEKCQDENEWHEAVHVLNSYRYSSWAREKLTKILVDMKEYALAFEAIEKPHYLSAIHKFRIQFLSFDPLLLQLAYINEFKALIDRNEAEVLIYYLHDLREMELPLYWLQTILYELLVYLQTNYPKRKKIRMVLENWIEEGDIL